MEKSYGRSPVAALQLMRDFRRRIETILTGDGHGNDRACEKPAMIPLNTIQPTVSKARSDETIAL
jgi:hypothetical protein